MFKWSNISILFAALLSYIIQSKQLNTQFVFQKTNQYIPINNNISQIDIGIVWVSKAITEEYAMRLSSVFKWTMNSIMNNSLQTKIFKPEINKVYFDAEQRFVYYLNYTLFYKDFLSSGHDLLYPRWSYSSCDSIKTLSKQSIIINEEYWDDCPDATPDDFYDWPIINENQPIYLELIFPYYQINSNFNIENSSQSHMIYFYMKKDIHDSYTIEQSKFNIHWDADWFISNPRNVTYVNLCKPFKNSIQKWFNDYNWFLHWSSRFEDRILMYSVYRNGIKMYLQILGTFNVFMNIFLFIPLLWSGYYITKLLINFYLFYYETKTLNASVNEHTNWSQFSYCMYWSIVYGCCCKKNRQLSTDITNMRMEILRDSEKLYNSKNADDVKFENVNEIDTAVQ